MVREDLNESVQTDKELGIKKNDSEKEMSSFAQHIHSSSMTALEFIASFKQQQSLYEEKLIFSLQEDVVSSQSQVHQGAMIYASILPSDKPENLSPRISPKNSLSCSSLSNLFTNKIDNYENNNEYCSKERSLYCTLINENGMLFYFSCLIKTLYTYFYSFIFNIFF